MKIAKDTLLFILGVSKSSAPLEFAGMLAAIGDIITEVVLVPGTESSDESAVMKLFMLPNIPTIGTVHSHPTSNRNPSRDDLELFRRKGKYHIIVGAPYDMYSWTCYNNKGEPINLEVVDYEFKEEDENW
ncbi:proteasome Rpn11 subunit JAMM motif [Candidatus Methanoperedens nitroreducens]|uniref:Proteasome Rpn11 subunit JAMM motif n=1 Tax=Candidatus Methanoperedens nitratireducens TaxID=1392998 RepID=A0A062V9B6_9EURY|nr:Mov34/MPN/PAD-1 family protein [Candidatus Methanoperedens nitroreducens]KCZ73143.1 proteasome Rpn11 subunit JAMM motif [Candidatus Methanoperedens nitroreducens]MDJ1422907.1 Mov34/MPN/PAD-1 family protein [Candidatus Methanoperedens sp.]